MLDDYCSTQGSKQEEVDKAALNNLRLFTESVGEEFIYIGANLTLSFSNFA